MKSAESEIPHKAALRSLTQYKVNVSIPIFRELYAYSSPFYSGTVGISPLNFLKYTRTIYQIPNACVQKTILVIVGNLFASFSLGAATYSG
jgi:hypothetical protein